MKNVEEVAPKEVQIFSVRIPGVPPPSGWSVKYLSGMEEVLVKSGYWLARWHVASDGMATFSFGPELVCHFDTQAKANAVSNALRESADIETEVVRIGG